MTPPNDGTAIPSAFRSLFGPGAGRRMTLGEEIDYLLLELGRRDRRSLTKRDLLRLVELLDWKNERLHRLLCDRDKR